MRGRKAFVRVLAATVGVLALSALSPAGAQQAVIPVGQSIVLSGPQAANGVLYAKGIRLHVDAVNAAGGVGGRQIKIIALDDAYDPEKGKENTRRLLEQDKVVALFGYTGTGITAASAPLAEAARVPLLAPLTGAPELREKAGRSLFFVRGSYLDELNKMAEFLAATGVRDIAVVYQDDGFGRSALKSAEAALTAHGLKPMLAAALTGKDYDATKAVAEVAAKAPAAVILATAGNASVNFIRGYRAAGKNAQFFGLSVVSSGQLLKDLGSGADGVVISQVVPSPWAKSTQLAREFNRDAEAAGETDLNHTTLEGYIAARVLVEALRRAAPEVTAERVTQALEGMRKYSVGGYEVSFAPDQRAGSQFVDLSLVRSTGRYVQ